MNRILTEMPPISDKDCFFLVDRHKTIFDYPIHRHDAYELNFVSNCKGVRRIVGDNIEILSGYDLALIGPNLEHCWEHHECDDSDKREITIQFATDLIPESLLAKNQLIQIRHLLKNASKGVAFGMDAIMESYTVLDRMTKEKPDFNSLLSLLELLYKLSLSKSQKTLASTSFAKAEITSDSRRVARVEEEIHRKYAENLSLDHLADIAGMTPSAFSRFFKLRTGRTLFEYIIDIRLGHAARLLVDTTNSISEICYQCGFNNLSNFNRAFKRTRGCTPKVFRDNYSKYKVLI